MLASAGATNLLLVTFLIPANAILLGIFVLGERLKWLHLGELGLIGLGLVSIDGRPWRLLRSLAYARWKASERKQVDNVAALL